MNTRTIFQNLNNIQRLACLIGILVLVVGMIFHNPLSGYVIRGKPLFPTEQGFDSVPCTEEQRRATRERFEAAERAGVYDDTPDANIEQFIDSMVELCRQQIPYSRPATKPLLPIAEWRTADPVVNWFGKILNLTQFILGVGVVVASALVLFKARTEVGV